MCVLTTCFLRRVLQLPLDNEGGQSRRENEADGVGSGGLAATAAGGRRARQLHVPEALLPSLQQLHAMFPKISITAIAEDLMKTNNNMQRTIENILNGLESEIPAVTRGNQSSIRPQEESRVERRQLAGLQVHFPAFECTSHMDLFLVIRGKRNRGGSIRNKIASARRSQHRAKTLQSIAKRRSPTSSN